MGLQTNRLTDEPMGEINVFVSLRIIEIAIFPYLIYRAYKDCSQIDT